MSELTIDVKRLVKALGGRAQLFRKLKAEGVSLSHRTIDNWVDRSSIPLKRFAALSAIAFSEGWELKISEYINDTKPTTKQKSK
jgi:hypothetical protein